MAKILVVDDDASTRDVVDDWLNHELHVVDAVADGKTALEFLTSYSYDIIVLDWGLPDVDGVSVLKKFRSLGGTTPVLMLTGKGEIEEKEQGLDSGADDYLTKPFDVKELSARIRALLRRAPLTKDNVLSMRDLTLNCTTRDVQRHGKPLKLFPKEFAVLEFLMRNPNQVFSSDALLERVWTADSEAGPETVRTCIRRLRKEIDVEGEDSLIETLHGVGYRFKARAD